MTQATVGAGRGWAERYARHIVLPSVGGLGQRAIGATWAVVDVAEPAHAYAALYLLTSGVCGLAIAGDLPQDWDALRMWAPVALRGPAASAVRPLARAWRHDVDVEVVAPRAAPQRAIAAVATLGAPPPGMAVDPLWSGCALAAAWLAAVVDGARA